jgi:lipoprotein-releasing system ATP-binding protein
MNEELLVASRVTKVFRLGSEEIWALKGIDLLIREGEMVAILGASGAGKSTLLHILGTLERPTSGSVKYRGRSVGDLKDEELSLLRNREMGFLFQFHYLLPDLNALENVMVPCLLAGLSHQESVKRAKEILERLDLGPRLKHRPGELSGGEQQRVALARALVMNPRIVLADEPTGNLDSKTGKRLIEILRDFNRSYGTTVVVVTHNLELASLFPRRIYMADGLLIKEERD